MAIYCVITVVVLLLVASGVIHYQHEKTREKILERAGKLLEEDSSKVEEVLDNMMGPEIRYLCSLGDDEFVIALNKKLRDM